MKADILKEQAAAGKTQNGGRLILTNMRFHESAGWRAATTSLYPDHGASGPVWNAWREACALWLKSPHFDVVVTLGARTSLLYGLLSLLTRRPSRQVMTEVFLDPPRPGHPIWAVKAWLFRRVAARALGVLTNSRHEQNVQATRLGIPPGRVLFVPLNANTVPVHPPPCDDRFIVAAGRSWRDYPTLLRALEGLSIPAHLFTGARDLQSVAPPSGVTIHRESSRADYLDHLRRCSFAVVPLLPTDRATGQVVLLEAMALGKPVVATRAPGTVDYLEEDRTGLLVEPEDESALRAAIRALWDDAGKAAHMGKEALRDTRERFGVEAHATAKLEAVAGLVNSQPGAPAHRRSGSRRFAALIGLFFAVAFHSGTWESGDEDRYYTLGRALHQGWGFVNAENPDRSPESITPPGYPALIALTMQAVGQNPQAIKWTGALFLWLTLITVHRLAQRLWPERPALAWATFLLGVCSVSLLAFSGMLMADLPAMLFGYLALLIHLRGAGSPSARAALLVGLLAGLAYLCRAATIALIGALLLDLACRRAWRPLAACIAGLTLIAAPWWYRNAVLLHVPDQYITYAVSGGAPTPGAGGLIHLLARETIRDLPVFLSKLPDEHFYQLFSGDTLLARVGLASCIGPFKFLFLAAVAAGWLLRLRRPGVLELFFPAHLLLISAYPQPFYDTNYLFPILPLSAFYFVHALDSGGAAFRRRGPLIAGLALTGCVGYATSTALAASLIHARHEWALRSYGPWDEARYRALGGEGYASWIRYAQAGGWLQSNTPPETLVASRKSKHTFVFSDRRGWRYDLPHEVGCTNAWEAMNKYPQVVFVEDAFAASKTTFNAYGNARVDVLEPLMAEHRDRLQLLYETPPPVTRLWLVAPAAAAPKTIR